MFYFLVNIKIWQKCPYYGCYQYLNPPYRTPENIGRDFVKTLEGRKIANLQYL